MTTTIFRLRHFIFCKYDFPFGKAIKPGILYMNGNKRCLTLLFPFLIIMKVYRHGKFPEIVPLLLNTASFPDLSSCVPKYPMRTSDLL